MYFSLCNAFRNLFFRPFRIEDPSRNRLASMAYFAKPATLRLVQVTVNYCKILNRIFHVNLNNFFTIGGPWSEQVSVNGIFRKSFFIVLYVGWLCIHKNIFFSYFKSGQIYMKDQKLAESKEKSNFYF